MTAEEFYALGKTLYGNGVFEKAFEAFEQAIVLSPKNTEIFITES